MKEFLQGKKTYIVAGLMVLVAVVNFLSGDISIGEVLRSENLQILLEGLGIAFLRAGVAKGEVKNG